MNSPIPFVVALKRNKNVERYISEELDLPVSFCELLDSDLNFNEVDCIWVDMTTKLDSSFLSKFTNLRYVATPTTGLTHLDLSSLKTENLNVISLKGEHDFLNEISATAELAWGLAMTVWRRIPLAALNYDDDVSVRSCFAGLQLRGLAIGTIGFGRLGRLLSTYAHAFGMRTLYFDPFIENFQAEESDLIYKCNSLAQLCRQSDIIFLVASHQNEHVPYYPILDRKHLEVIRSHSIVVNVSRGSLLDEEALADLILKGSIFGAGVDVLAREEVNEEGPSRLQSLQRSGLNVVVTPHIGGMCSDAFEKAHRFTAKKLKNKLAET